MREILASTVHRCVSVLMSSKERNRNPPMINVGHLPEKIKPPSRRGKKMEKTTISVKPTKYSWELSEENRIERYGYGKDETAANEAANQIKEWVHVHKRTWAQIHGKGEYASPEWAKVIESFFRATYPKDSTPIEVVKNPPPVAHYRRHHRSHIASREEVWANSPGGLITRHTDVRCVRWTFGKNDPGRVYVTLPGTSSSQWDFSVPFPPDLFGVIEAPYLTAPQLESLATRRLGGPRQTLRFVGKKQYSQYVTDYWVGEWEWH